MCRVEKKASIINRQVGSGERDALADVYDVFSCWREHAEVPEVSSLG